MDINKKVINIDSLELRKNTEVYRRQRLIFGVTFFGIICVFLLIIGIVIGLCDIVITQLTGLGKVSESYHFLELLSKNWHFYLISLVALTTVLSVLAMLNKATWYEKNEVTTAPTSYSPYTLDDILKSTKLKQ
jgi:H+/Cl- antiporter ClcA